MMEGGCTRPVNVAHEVKFAYQSQNGLFGSGSMAHNVLE